MYFTGSERGTVWTYDFEAEAGSVDQVIGLPVPRPTNCALGGPDLRTLYVTSARDRLSPEQLAAAPLSGHLFTVAVDVPGLPEPTFAG